MPAYRPMHVTIHQLLITYLLITLEVACVGQIPPVKERSALPSVQ